jgi:hypothetical protein
MLKCCGLESVAKIKVVIDDPTRGRSWIIRHFCLHFDIERLSSAASAVLWNWRFECIGIGYVTIESVDLLFAASLSRRCSLAREWRILAEHWCRAQMNGRPMRERRQRQLNGVFPVGNAANALLAAQERAGRMTALIPHQNLSNSAQQILIVRLQQENATLKRHNEQLEEEEEAHKRQRSDGAGGSSSGDDDATVAYDDAASSEISDITESDLEDLEVALIPRELTERQEAMVQVENTSKGKNTVRAQMAGVFAAQGACGAAGSSTAYNLDVNFDNLADLIDDSQRRMLWKRCKKMRQRASISPRKRVRVRARARARPKPQAKPKPKVDNTVVVTEMHMHANN